LDDCTSAQRNKVHTAHETDKRPIPSPKTGANFKPLNCFIVLRRPNSKSI